MTVGVSDGSAVSFAPGAPDGSALSPSVGSADGDLGPTGVGANVVSGSIVGTEPRSAFSNPPTPIAATLVNVPAATTRRRTNAIA